jgi:hypothetical protein
MKAAQAPWERRMTICVAVKVHDCLVFAVDSAKSIQLAHRAVIEPPARGA